MKNGMSKIWTHELWIQSQLCLPLAHEFMKNNVKIKSIWQSTFKFKIYPIFDSIIWNLFFQNMWNAWNHIFIKFLAMKLNPCLNSNGLNEPGDAMTAAYGE